MGGMVPDSQEIKEPSHFSSSSCGVKPADVAVEIERAFGSLVSDIMPGQSVAYVCFNPPCRWAYGALQLKEDYGRQHLDQAGFV
jgi:hypothetical protein